MIVERAPNESGYDLLVRLVTRADDEYEAFRAYLVNRNPAHRYGYGP